MNHVSAAEPCGLTYFQSGGSDPAVVAQMTDLQAEAQSLEGNHTAAAAAAASAEDRSRSKTLSSTQQRHYSIYSISLLNISLTFLFARSVNSELCRITVLSGNKAEDPDACCRFKTGGKFPLSHITVSP